MQKFKSHYLYKAHHTVTVNRGSILANYTFTPALLLSLMTLIVVGCLVSFILLPRLDSTDPEDRSRALSPLNLMG